MRSFREYVIKALASGFLLALPVYLAVLLMLKAMKSFAGLVRPLAALHPAGMSSAFAEQALAFLLVAVVCFVLGAVILTPRGRAVRERLEETVFAKIPGYSVVKSLTQQLAGHGHENAWTPALVDWARATSSHSSSKKRATDDALSLFRVSPPPSPDRYILSAVNGCTR